MISPIDHRPTPEIGNFFDWIKEAAPKIKKTAQDVLPVVKQYKDALSSNGVPAYYVPGQTTPTTVYQNPNQTTYNQNANNNNDNNNKTALYIGLAAAAIVVIILLNKK